MGTWERLLNPAHLNSVWKFSPYNQINDKDMEIVINGKNNIWKDNDGRKTNI